MKKICIAAYWGSRKESADECAGRVISFFEKMREICPELCVWRERGRSKKLAIGNPPVDLLSMPTVKAQLEKGRNRTDAGRQVIEELGFQVGLWEPSQAGENSFSLHCGSCSQWVGNNLLVDFTMEEERLAPIAGALIQSVAEAWEPDWAGIIESPKMNSPEFSAKVPFLDIALYVKNRASIQGLSLVGKKISEARGGGCLVA